MSDGASSWEIKLCYILSTHSIFGHFSLYLSLVDLRSMYYKRTIQRKLGSNLILSESNNFRQLWYYRSLANKMKMSGLRLDP